MNLQPKKSTADSVSFFERAPGPPNDTEVLFFSLLVCSNGDRVSDLELWASSVLRYESSYCAGPFADMPDDRKVTRKVNTPPILSPLALSYTGVWDMERLKQIAKAIQMWDGPGAAGGLCPSGLKNHRAWKPSKGGPRWKSLEALFGVARLVTRSGVVLRRLLEIVEPIESLPWPYERAQQAEAAVRQLQTSLEVEKAAKVKAIDAHRQAASRLKKKNKAVGDAVKGERRRVKALSKKQRKERLAHAKAARLELVARAKTKAEKQVAEETKKLLARIAAARKRARKVEGVANLSSKRLRRAKKAEKSLKELQLTLEEESDEEEEEEEECTTQTRRDARGRYKAMPWKLRVLFWAQLAHAGSRPAL